MKRVMMLVAVMVTVVGAGNVRAEEDAGINVKGKQEAMLQDSGEAEYLKLCTDEKMVNCDKISVLAAYEVVLRVRECMKGKGLERDRENHWKVGQTAFDECLSQAKPEGAQYVAHMKTCQNDKLCDHHAHHRDTEKKPLKAEKPTKQSSSATDIPPGEQLGPHPRIGIWNASGTDKEAARIRDLLVASGFPKADVDTIKPNWVLTTVECRKGYKQDCLRIKSILGKDGFIMKDGLGDIGRAEKHDVKIILGVSRKPVPKPEEVADKGEDKKDEIKDEVQPEEDDGPNWFQRNPKLVARILGIPAISPMNATVRGLWSFPDRLHALPMPNATVGPTLRLMFDNEYAPFAFWGGPLLNTAYQTSVLSATRVPIGVGAQLGGEAWYPFMLHKPFTKSQQQMWLADKVMVGGYGGAEFMQTLLNPSGISSLKVWGQQYGLIRFGGSFRFDWASWGGVILRTGPTIGLKYAREDGFWQRGQTIFPAFGWEFGIESYFRIPNLTDQLSGEQRDDQSKK